MSEVDYSGESLYRLQDLIREYSLSTAKFRLGDTNSINYERELGELFEEIERRAKLSGSPDTSEDERDSR